MNDPFVNLTFLKKIKWLLTSFLIALGGAILGAFGLAMILANDLYEYQDTVDGVHLPSVDAIVCLAGGKGRIAGAGDIWYRYREAAKEGKTPYLYLSGMGRQSIWAVVTTHLRAGVRAEIRPDDVIVENESENTEANARWLLRHATQKGWQRILLITSPYHMKRARLIFEKIGMAEGKELGLETLSIFQEPFEALEWRYSLLGIRVTLSEYAKWIYYRYFWDP